MSRRRFYLIGFLALIVFDTLAQVCFKFAALDTPFSLEVGWFLRVLAAPWVYAAVLGYLGAFVTWMTLLKYAPIGPAFAASHLEVVGVMILSVPLFGERLSVWQFAGAAAIIAGVLCLASSQDEPVEELG
ncbi:MAG TPA: EamA family transporter [Burkholderiales bacterium]|nr:EamA family transporter [Burkholderiales bacterium]